MGTQPIPSERRRHPRKGVLANLENITYGLLRTCGIGGEDTRKTMRDGSLQRVQQRCRTTSAGSRSSQPRFRFFEVVLAFLRSKKIKGRSWLRRKGTAMTANLVIVVSNPRPKREPHYPETWLLYSQGQGPVEVHVARDRAERPHVVDEGVASDLISGLASVV